MRASIWASVCPQHVERSDHRLVSTDLISLFNASSCSCSMRASVWTSVCPLGDGMSNAPITDSFSLPSVSLVSNACWTLARICACFNFSYSWSFNVLTCRTKVSLIIFFYQRTVVCTKCSAKYLATILWNNFCYWVLPPICIVWSNLSPKADLNFLTKLMQNN